MNEKAIEKKLEYNKKYNSNRIVQTALTPLCKDIVEYISLLKKAPIETNEGRVYDKASKSLIVSKIVSEHFKDQSRIPEGFWEWRENKNKLKGS